MVRNPNLLEYPKKTIGFKYIKVILGVDVCRYEELVCNVATVMWWWVGVEVGR